MQEPSDFFLLPGSCSFYSKLSWWREPVKTDKCFLFLCSKKKKKKTSKDLWSDYEKKPKYQIAEVDEAPQTLDLGWSPPLPFSLLFALFSNIHLLALPQTLQERPCLWDLALTAFSSWTPLPKIFFIYFTPSGLESNHYKAFPGHSKIWNQLPAPFSFPHFLLNSYQHHTFSSFYLT